MLENIFFFYAIKRELLGKEVTVCCCVFLTSNDFFPEENYNSV